MFNCFYVTMEMMKNEIRQCEKFGVKTEIISDYRADRSWENEIKH